MYRYIFHEAVKTDYDEAYMWYEGKSKGLGERFLSVIRAKLDEIAKRPEAFGARSKRGLQDRKNNFCQFHTSPQEKSQNEA